MKKFEFRLQRLLDIRKDKEEEQRIVLARASGEYQQAVNKKTEILDRVNASRERLKENPSDLSAYRSFDLMEQNAGIAISEIEIEIEAKRKAMQRELDLYTQLKKDRRAVELLREKALREYQEEVRKEETRNLDEIGTNMFLQAKGNSEMSDT